MTITSYLNNKGFITFEGYSQQVPEQVTDLIKLTQNGKKRVIEIGFNAGHSAEVFLENNPELELVSFDLGSNKYVSIAKEYAASAYLSALLVSPLAQATSARPMIASW